MKDHTTRKNGASGGQIGMWYADGCDRHSLREVTRYINVVEPIVNSP